jgi:hypothetical protein
MSPPDPPTGRASDIAPALDDVLRTEVLPDAPPLGATLEAELGALAPVRLRRPWVDLAIVIAVSLAYAGALLAYMTVRGDLAVLPPGWVIGFGAAWALSFGALLYLAMVPRRGAVMPRWRHAGVAAAVAALLFLVAGYFLEGRPGAELPVLSRETAVCLRTGALTALVPVVLGALLLRRAMPVGARWTAAALGAAGGSLGGLLLHLHCPLTDGSHVAVAHGGVVLLGAAVAALLTPRLRP